jgi:hypothetical protein
LIAGRRFDRLILSRLSVSARKLKPFVSRGPDSRVARWRSEGRAILEREANRPSVCERSLDKTARMKEEQEILRSANVKTPCQRAEEHGVRFVKATFARNQDVREEALRQLDSFAVRLDRCDRLEPFLGRRLRWSWIAEAAVEARGACAPRGP